jgi:hypothetical protein
VRQLPPEAAWRNHDAIQCLECEQWRSALGRHLSKHDMTADEYRAAWGMRQRQPLTAGYLSQVRREVAVATGGPDRMRKLAPQVAPLAAAARVGRERREQERRSLHHMQAAVAARSAAQAESRAGVAARRLGFADVGGYLMQRYVADRQPVRVLAAELAVNKQVVRRLMDQHRVSPRGPGPAPVVEVTRWAHGVNGYRSYGCRCDVCTASNTIQARADRANRAARLKADPTLVEHGTANAYNQWGCRCTPCTRAWTRRCAEGERRRRKG